MSREPEREEEEGLTFEEMARNYSKKWNVPVEEAKRKLKAFIEGKPQEDRAKALPTSEFPLPEPLGPISRKVIDMNQAALSGAYTTSKLRELSMPPKEIENLKTELENVKQTVNATLELVNTRVQQLQQTLDTKRAEEERTKIIQELETKVIAPIKNDVEAVKKAVEAGNKGGTTESMRALAEKVKTAEEDAIKVLQEMGYQIPPKTAPAPVPPAASPNAPEAMDVQTAVEWLKRQGYKVEPNVISKEEAQKMVEEAMKKAQEEALDNERIKAVSDVIREAVKEVIGLFRTPLESYFKTAFESRQTPGETPAAG